MSNNLYVKKGDNASIKLTYSDNMGIAHYNLGSIQSSNCAISLSTIEGVFNNNPYSATDYAGNTSLKGNITYYVDGTSPSVTDIAIKAKAEEASKFFYKDSFDKMWIKYGTETIVEAKIEDPLSANVSSGFQNAVLKNSKYKDGQFKLKTDAQVYELSPDIVATDMVNNVSYTNIGKYGVDSIAPNIHFNMPVTVDDLYQGKSWSGVQYKGYVFASTPAGERVDYNGKSFDIQEAGAFTFVAADNVNNEVSYTLVASDDKHCVIYNDTVIYASVDKDGKLNIPDGAKAIRENLMKDSLSLEELVIPESVKKIEDNAFKGCKNLKKLDIESKDVDIPSNAFEDTNPDLVVNLKGTITPIGIYTNKGTLNWDLTGDPTGKFEGYQNLKNEGKLTLTVKSDDVSGNEYVIATGNFSDLTDKNTFTLTGVKGQDDVEISIDDDVVCYNGHGYKLFVEGVGNNAKLVLRVVETYTLVLEGGKAYKSLDNGQVCDEEVTVAGLSYDATTGWTMNNFSFHTSATTVVYLKDNLTTITVSGENAISGGGGEMDTYGMRGTDINIKGTGTLTITAGNAKGEHRCYGGLHAQNISVQDAVLDITAKSGIISCGLANVMNNMNVTGSARVTTRGETSAVSIGFDEHTPSPAIGAQWNNKVLDFKDNSYYSGSNVATQAILTKAFDTRLDVPAGTKELGEEGKETIYTAGPSEGNGGAVLVQDGGELDAENVIFANNLVSGDSDGDGGALYVEEGGQAKLDSVTFNNNSASHDGGAIYNEGSINMTGDANFNNNKAGDNGGAISNINPGEIVIDCPADFNNNEAGKDGGAINNIGEIEMKDVVSFNGNTAGNNGGAINNASPGKMKFDKDATFTGNYAKQGGAIYNSGTMTFNGAATFNGNNAAQGGGAIYNEGTINFANTVKLATETDSIYNKGILNWDLTGDPTGKLENFQYLRNDGGKLNLSINAGDLLGDSYEIATGDFSDVTGKDVFTLSGVPGQPDVDIVINGGAFYNGKFYTLTVRDGKLVLAVSTPPTYEYFPVDSSWKNLRKGEIITVGGKTYYYGINAFSNTEEAVNNSQDGTEITMDSGTDAIKDNATLNDGATLKVNDSSLTIADGKKLTGGKVEVGSSEGKTTTLKGEIGSETILKDGVTLGEGTNVYFNDNVTLEKEATLTEGAQLEKYGQFDVGQEDTLNIVESTLKTRSGSIVNNGTMNLTEANLNSGNYPVKNSGNMNVYAGTTTITANNPTGGAFTNGSDGVLNLNKGALLEFSDQKVLNNYGAINMNGGKVADDVTINNYGELNWDLTDRDASPIKWNKLNNDGFLGATVGLEQPKDTTYILANNVTGNYIGTKFVLRGYGDLTDTLTLGAVESEVKGYGNRLYRLQVENGQLKLRVLPGVCKIGEVFYNTLDLAIAAVKEGETIELLTNIDMENSLEMPAGTYIDLAGFKLTNPAGLDLKWDLTSDKAPAVKDFDKLNALGTLTLSVNDMQTRKDYVIARDAAEATGRVFTLPGDVTYDKKTRTLAVNDGKKLFYGHRFYSLNINGNNEIVLTVEKVIPENNEFWAVSTDGTQLTLSNTQGYDAGHVTDTPALEDAMTKFVFDGDVTRIALAALENNDKLKEIYFPASVEFVGQYAFEDCKNLVYVSTGEKLEKINDRAFNGCSKLLLIDLEDNKELKEIAAYAFGGNESLKSVTLPASVEYVGSRAFYGCKNLTSVTLMGTDPEKINMTGESFKDMADNASVFVQDDKLLTFEAYNYGKGINFQTKKTVQITGTRTSIFCHHNMIVPAGITVYGATWDESKFNFNAVTGLILEGGKGYILEGAVGNYVVETTSKEANAVATATNDLVGVMELTSADELGKYGKVYVVDPVSGYAMTEMVASGHLDAYTACAVITIDNSPLVKLFDFDAWYYGWTTGVNNTLSPTTDSQQQTYNVAGQQVGDSYKGIVIVNGKKSIRK